MPAELNHEHVIGFLNHQMNELDEKLARLQSALDSCEDCLEANGLRATLHNAEIEHSLLQELLMSQLNAQTLSLDTAIIQRVEQLRREANRLAQHWQRGRETPPAYWDVEVKQSFLTDLLSRFHAYEDSRPVDQEPNPIAPEDEIQTGTAFPWFVTPPASDQPAAPATNRLREEIFSALRRNGLPFDHMELFVEANGQVIVIGYAHDDDERKRILRAITDVEGVSQTVADVKVVDPAACPVCNARKPPLTH
jgi:hypothetical protein